MFKVLVVDDEPIMLEGWKTMVDWSACGYELCGTATDGAEALALIEIFEPDLVVTDIQMPVLDGIGLIRAMKEEKGTTAKTVIVSGHSEFSYAQQALRYQVDRYLLKPLFPEEIHKLLHELTGPLTERQLVEASVSKVQAAAAASAIVGLLRQGSWAAVQTAERLLGVNGQTHCRLILAEATANVVDSGDSETSGSTINARMQRIIDCFRESGLEAWLFEETPSRAGVLVADHRLNDEQFEFRLKMIVDGLNGTYKRMKLYCSNCAQGLASLPLLYRQTMEVRSQVRHGHRSGVHLYRERAISGEFRLEDVTSYSGSLLRSIEEGDLEGIGNSVEGLLRLLDRSGAQEGWGQAAVQHIRGELLRNYAGADDESDWLCQLLSESPTDQASWTGDSLKQLCIRVLEQLAVRKTPTRATSSAMKNAVAYIKGHYQNKLKLQDLAEKYGFNPVYFGQQFKQETGVGFHDYIHRLRIEEAQRMLRRTDMKVSDIAQTLGYHDTEYFTLKFKALTGGLPSSYKKNGKGDQRA